MGSRVGIATIGLLAMGALAGCGSAQSPASMPAPPATAAAAAVAAAAGPGAHCGQVRTAAGFPAAESVVRGEIPCATVTKVFTAYYAALAAGQAPGNGGGGPVTVDGWTCQSAPAMAAPLSTCDKGGVEIAARAEQG